MASPNYDALHVRLSRMIGDPVAAAATNGNSFTSALRDHFLNDGVRRLMNHYVKMRGYDSFSAIMVEPAFFAGGYLADEAQTLASNVKALSSWTGGVFSIVTARNATASPNVVINPLPHRYKDLARTGVNRYLNPATGNQWYIIEGATLRVLGSGATDSVNLQYIKPHTDLTNGNATDILVPAAYWNEVLDEAYKIFAEEYPEEESLARLQLKEGALNREINIKAANG